MRCKLHCNHSGTHIIGPALLAAAMLWSLQVQADDDPFPELSLEALGDVMVTSVSKKEEKKSASAASIFVLTGDEIRAHGIKTLAEAMRLIPGLSIARAGSADWAISARGFNSTLADKMEVVMDGRSLYTPLFSGVFWDAQHTFIDDIERIEVIRGPGASVWGANAVNGVINIVTKSSEHTQGNLVNVGAGTALQGQAGYRHGGTLSSGATYRAYAQATKYGETESAAGQGNNDDWSVIQAGFRTDFTNQNNHDFTIQGDVYDGRSSSNSIDGDISGVNILGRWSIATAPGSEFQLQSYVDLIERQLGGQFQEERLQFEIEAVHNFSWMDHHDIVWGLSYRLSDDDLATQPGSNVSFDPESEQLSTFGAFIQDQIRLDETLNLTLGTKVENNDFTGTEIQPTVRLAWTPDPLHTVWGALSRAVRTPNRFDRDSNIATFSGSDAFESEEVVTIESGYRFPLFESTTADITLFYSEYEELRAITTNGQTLQAENLGEGDGWGVESSFLWIPGSKSSWLFAYRYLDIDLEFPPNSFSGQLNADPKHQAMIRGTYSLSKDTLLSGMLRHSDSLPTSGGFTQGQGIPSYTELNLGVIHKLTDSIDLSLHAENLLNSSHFEFSDEAAIERSVYAEIEWHF